MFEVWQSVKEYLILTTRTWWSVLTLFTTIVGLVLVFVPLSSVPTWAGIIIIFLGLMVGQFGAFYRVRLERERLKESSPTIDVEPKRGTNDFYLNVKNVGGTATFKAQISARQKGSDDIDPALELYYGWWEQAAGSIAPIATYHADRVKIACIPSSPLFMHLRLYFYDAENDRKNWRESHSWHPMAHDPSLRPEYILHVTISSTSSPMKPFTNSYVLRSDLFAELGPG